MEYPAINDDMIDRLAVLGDRVFLEWEEAKDELVKGVSRPETYKERQYTGVIIKLGTDVDMFAGGIFLLRKDIERALEDGLAAQFLLNKLDEIDRFGHELSVGQRVLFEQFSGFEKYQSPDGRKRYAFVKAGACHAILPPRAKVRSEEWTQYGEGE